MSIYDGVPISQNPQIFGGRPVIANHRVTVHSVAALFQAGETPETIAEDFSLTLDEVEAALAYYHDHRCQLDREIAEDRRVIAELETELARRHGHSGQTSSRLVTPWTEGGIEGAAFTGTPESDLER